MNFGRAIGISPQVPVWMMASLQRARVMACGLVRCGRLVWRRGKMVALVWGEPSFSCSWCGLYPIGRWLSFCVWGARIPPEKNLPL